MSSLLSPKYVKNMIKTLDLKIFSIIRNNSKRVYVNIYMLQAYQAH